MAGNEEQDSAFSSATAKSTEQEHLELKRRKSDPKMSNLRISPSIYASHRQNPAKVYSSLRTATIILLPILSITGLTLTWFLGLKNGLLGQLDGIFAQKPFPYLPGTNEPLILRYSGIKLVDRYLSVLVAVFAPAVSGEYPDMSIFGKVGLGWFGAAWTLMVMESLRVGNRGRLVSYPYIAIFGFLIQTATLTVTAPIYLTLQLLTSPISHPNPSAYPATALSISPADLHVLPVTILLSFVLPSFLMSLPFQNPDTLEGTGSTSLTPTMHQYLIALWQFFPTLTILIHWGLKNGYIFVKRISGGQVPIADIKHDPAKSPSKSTATTRPATPSGSDYLRAVRPVYRFILGFLILTHFPNVLSTLLPLNIAKALYLPSPSLSFAETFIPSSPFSLLFSSNGPNRSQTIELFKRLLFGSNLTQSAELESLKEQSLDPYPKFILTFLQYDIYIATLSFLLWSYHLYHTSLTEKSLLDPNSLPSYSPRLSNNPNSPSNNYPTFNLDYPNVKYETGDGNDSGFFSRQTNPMYRDLLSGRNQGFGMGKVKAYGLSGRGTWVRCVVRWGGWCLVGGPMAVVVLLVWERDEIVRRKVKQGN